MYRVIPVLLLSLVLFSCQENKEFDSYTIGDDFIQSETNIALVDTFEVELSSFKFDSIITSNTGSGLIGAYSDPELGIVRSNCYSQFGFNTSGSSITKDFGIDEEDKFDSLTVTLRVATDGFIGDSTVLQTFNVYKLSDELETLEDGYLYNTSHFEFEEEEIGSISFVPADYAGKNLEIRLKDEIGITWINRLRNDVDTVKIFNNNTKFLNYFPGLVFRSVSDNGCILTTNISDSLLYLSMYTSKVEYDVVSSIHKFPSINSNNQFNQIISDRTETDANALSETRRSDISSSLTGMKSYVQGGLGYYTRVEIPGLYRVLDMTQKRLLLRAELIVKPVSNSYNDNTPLPNLHIYESNQINALLSEIVNDNDEALVASPVMDSYYPDNTYYSFDVTTFISTELADGYFDVDHGLAIGLEYSNVGQVLDRVVLSDSRDLKFRPYLKLYYVFYQ